MRSNRACPALALQLYISFAGLAQHRQRSARLYSTVTDLARLRG
jgi:hypothetical protein